MDHAFGWAGDYGIRHPGASSALIDGSRFEVSLAAIEHNAGLLRQLVGPDCLLVAALKCDAYGFGLLPVADRLQRSHVDVIAVARLSDAIALRTGGISLPILLYGGSPVTNDYANAVESYDLMPTVLDRAAVSLLSSAFTRERPVWLKVDVGLRRLGTEPAGLAQLANVLARASKLRLEGIYTHMTVPADPVPAGHIERQHSLFLDCIAQVERNGIEVPIRLAASSSVLRLREGLELDAIDPGLLYFGLVPSGPAIANYEFRAAFGSLRTRLVQIKLIDDDPRRPPPPVPLAAGARVGVLPLGIADGLTLATAADVLVRGRRAPLLEPPSLEHCRVDLTSIPDAEAGDEVVLIGRQGADEITLDEVAGWRGLTNRKYQIPIGIRSSVERDYID